MLKNKLKISLLSVLLLSGVVLSFIGLYGYMQHHLAAFTKTVEISAFQPMLVNVIIIACCISLLSVILAFAILRLTINTLNDASISSKTLEAIPDSVGIVKLRDSKVMWMNHGLAHLTGYSREETLGQSVVDLEIWLEPMQGKKFIEELKVNQVSDSIETTIIRKNGEHIQVLMSGKVTPFEEESCVFLMISNPTAHKQVEKELILAEAQYRSFIQHTKDAIIRYDNEIPVSIMAPLQEQKASLAKSLVKECNSVACRLFGVSSMENILGKRYEELMDKTNDIYFLNMLDEYIANNYKLDDYIYVLKKRRPNNDLAYLSISASGVIENAEHVRIWVTIKDITERMKAEQALKFSEEKLSKVLHASGDAIVLTSLTTGKIIDCSESGFHLLGYKIDDVIGKSTTDLNMYVDRTARQKIFNSVMKDGSVANREIKLRNKTGEIIVVLLSAEKIMLENQAYMISTLHDITYLHEAAKKLERYETIISSITDAVVVIDDNDRYEYVNDQYLKLLNESKENVIGKSMQDVLGKEVFNKLTALIRSKFSGETKSLEYWGIMPITGDYVCNEITLSRFKGRNDDNWSLLAVGRDITERKQDERILRENERRYRSILEATKVIPWELDIDSWKPTYIGPQIREQLGYEPEDWMRDGFWLRHIDPLDRQEVDNFYHLVKKQNKSNEIQYRIYDSDNKTLWIRDIVTPITDNDGNRLLQGIMVDMTDSKEKEKQLFQAQKMEAVGRLTGGIAHDFNNLLTIIRGNISFLAQSFNGKDADIEEMLADALSASDDGAELTGQLLAFSRKQSLKPQSIDINKQIEMTVRLFRRMVSEDIEFNITLAKNNPVSHIDPSKFDNTLINLMINARDAMGPGDTLSIKAGDETITSARKLKKLGIQAGHYTTITVTDNGSGMDTETIKQACEPFFTTKDADKGTGLGLSMVYGFVNQSNGGIDISSQIGVGTSITLYLPEGGQPDNGSSQEEENTAPPILIEESKKETVLVTEDEARVRKFAVKCLQSLGYNVIEAQDAETAISVLKINKSINILFTDNILPGTMNGRGLAGWAAENYPDIKIILATGFSESNTGGPSVYDGRFPLLRKPYSKEDLAEQLSELVEDRLCTPH